MLFVFVRHGHRQKPSPGIHDRKCGLTAAGIDAARLAGEFLRDNGIVPDLVVTTDATRTIETAEILLGVLGPLPGLARCVDTGGFTSPAEFPEKLAEWAATSDKPVATLLFVGHRPSQLTYAKLLKRSKDLPPRNKCGVLIGKSIHSGILEFVDSYPGTAPG